MSMSHLCTLVAAAAVLWAGVSAQAPPTGTRCKKIDGQPGCVCKGPDGIINMTFLANTDGTPRFSKGISYEGFDYLFNPCNKFNHTSSCQNVYVCQQNSKDKSAYDVADGNEQIWYDKDGVPYLYYTGSDKRNTRVYLHCDPTVKGEPEITTKGDSNKTLSYVMNLRSAEVCPGAGPPGTPPGETIAGPIGIAVIFVLLGALLAYFIIGAIVMKVKFENTGADIIPNKSFWFDLPFLIKDGVLLTFSPCITAYRGRGYNKA